MDSGIMRIIELAEYLGTTKERIRDGVADGTILEPAGFSLGSNENDYRWSTDNVCRWVTAGCQPCTKVRNYPEEFRKGAWLILQSLCTIPRERMDYKALAIDAVSQAKAMDEQIAAAALDVRIPFRSGGMK